MARRVHRDAPLSRGARPSRSGDRAVPPSGGTSTSAFAPCCPSRAAVTPRARAPCGERAGRPRWRFLLASRQPTAFAGSLMSFASRKRRSSPGKAFENGENRRGSPFHPRRDSRMGIQSDALSPELRIPEYFRAPATRKNADVRSAGDRAQHFDPSVRSSARPPRASAALCRARTRSADRVRRSRTAAPNAKSADRRDGALHQRGV